MIGDEIKVLQLHTSLRHLNSVQNKLLYSAIRHSLQAQNSCFVKMLNKPTEKFVRHLVSYDKHTATCIVTGNLLQKTVKAQLYIAIVLSTWKAIPIFSIPCTDFILLGKFCFDLERREAVQVTKLFLANPVVGAQL